MALGVTGCGGDDGGNPDACPLAAPFCGGDFPLNTLQTTEYGPAWADVSTSASDFVPCFGPYALCYYAECTVSQDGTVSDCPCFEWFGTSYVMINGILNLDVYQATKSGLSCDVAPQVWSAAYAPNMAPPNPCEIVGGCVPDAPPDQCGCPLYDSGTMLPPGSGIDCNEVCEEYDSCQRNGTLCGTAP